MPIYIVAKDVMNFIKGIIIIYKNSENHFGFDISGHISKVTYFIKNIIIIYKNWENHSRCDTLAKCLFLNIDNTKI